MCLLIIEEKLSPKQVVGRWGGMVMTQAGLQNESHMDKGDVSVQTGVTNNSHHKGLRCVHEGVGLRSFQTPLSGLFLLERMR